jgi:hypothetical protein
MVTHSTTNSPILDLSMGERTGTRIVLGLWPYVEMDLLFGHYMRGYRWKYQSVTSNELLQVATSAAYSTLPDGGRMLRVCGYRVSIF